MDTLTVEQIYEKHIKPLSRVEQRSIISIAVKELSNSEDVAKPTSKRSVMEFRGVGKGSRDETDAQDYVDSLRKEWDHRL